MDMRTVEQENDPMEAIAEGRDPTTTSWGHYKSRQRHPQGRIRIGGAITGFFSHATHVARITAYVYPAHFAHSILRRTDVQRAIEGRRGRRGYARIVDSLKLQTVRYYDKSTGQRFTRWLTGRIAVSKLGMRPTTWLLNIAGLYTTATYEMLDGNPGFEWLHKGLRQAADPKVRRRVTAEALASSASWRRRYQDDFMNEAFSGLGGEGETHFGRPPIGEYGLSILKYSDSRAGIVRWLMAEQKRAWVLAGKKDAELTPEQAKAAKDPDELALEWMRLLFNGESTSHGGDMTGAIAEGRRNAYFAPFVMFLSAASRMTSLAWRIAMTPFSKHTVKALGGLGFTVLLITAIRELFDLFDEDKDPPTVGKVVRRAVTEAVSPYPLIGSNLVPVAAAIMNEPAPTFPASASEEFLQDITRLSVSAVGLVQDAVSGDLNADLEPEAEANALRFADDLAAVLANLVGGGLPYEGTRDMLEWVIPNDDKSPISVDGVDVTQPVRRIRRGLRDGNNSLFRGAVREWEEVKGEPMSSREPLSMINRWLGSLTKFEPGKPARDNLSAEQLEEIDGLLREREELRQSAVDMTELNSDLFEGEVGRQKRQKRPTRPKRPRRPKR